MFQPQISELDIITYPSMPKTAFTSPFGKYEYLKVSFRLAQACVPFQGLMNKVLKDLPFAIACLDNIIIYSRTAEDHLQQVFHSLQNFIQTPILHYPDPSKWYIVYTAASYYACEAQLSQEHYG